MPVRPLTQIRAARPGDAEAIRQVLCSIIREGRFLDSDEPPGDRHFAAFVRANLSRSAPFFVAVQPGSSTGAHPREQVLGWCDVLAATQASRRHSGRVGMGVHHNWRGRGLGRRLLEQVIRTAWQRDYQRLDLEVFTNNRAAIGLYQSLGFVVEGEHHRVRYGPGGWQNTYTMALLR